MDTAPLETVESLAARLGVPRRTVLREVMRSRLPYVSVGGLWRFRERDIDVWLQRTGGLPRLTLLHGCELEPDDRAAPPRRGRSTVS